MGKNCFVKHATHLSFLEQQVKIGMELILRWRSAQGVQSTVNGCYQLEPDLPANTIVFAYLKWI